MIGLVDYDWIQSKKNTILIPNLEIMKLATYYKVEENHFCRLLTLEEQELSSYDKIYFYSEITDKIEIPEPFLRANNVIFGGSKFTKNYIPFENDLIDFTIPKPFIYSNFLKQKYNDGVKNKVIERALEDTYYRNYAGNQKLPLPPIRKNRRVFLFDVDFFYPDWEKTINEISIHKPANIIRLHPVICHTLTEYFTLRKFQKFSRANEVVLDLDIPLDDLPYLFKHYKNLLLADITKTSNVSIFLGGSWKSQNQYFKDFIYKLNLLYSLWSQGIFIKIKFLPPETGFINPLLNLEILTESIFNLSTDLKLNGTLDEKISKKRKDSPVIIEKELLLKHYPRAKNLFNQSFLSLYQRRVWRV